MKSCKSVVELIALSKLSCEEVQSMHTALHDPLPCCCWVGGIFESCNLPLAKDGGISLASWGLGHHGSAADRCRNRNHFISGSGAKLLSPGHASPPSHASVATPHLAVLSLFHYYYHHHHHRRAHELPATRSLLPPPSFLRQRRSAALLSSVDPSRCHSFIHFTAGLVHTTTFLDFT
jgi:hypothetical protein